MQPQVLYSDRLHVHYGQFYVEPQDGDFADMALAFRGQSNGICGAAQTGRLFLITGIHTGHVHVTVELLDAAPLADPSWEEIVECSFAQHANALLLREWGQEAEYPLDIPQGTYRVRYSARSMLGDWQLTDDDGPMQVYLLQFWPAPRNADVVTKVSGECARYWHGEMSKTRE
ncbi:hypothetical protein [Thiocystis violacea]|uniref:hypothetical protein n=1 Tax=Thiocystis violacea TaxID=13725 RepID=UPI0019079035|nr:hypothetical protein [Thiocystis violacea]MBK1718134.1 hypothetical protein [Thiocystis violacea]